MKISKMLKLGDKFKISKKYKNNQELVITVLIVLGIVMVLNIFASQIFWRVDLTGERLYSISNTTKETVRQLPDLVTVKVYFSDNLPNQYVQVKQQVIDMLNDYENYGSNFSFEVINPGDGVEAEKAGVPQIQFNEVKKDKFEVGNGYMGLVINYQDKKEVIPVLENVTSLEYQLTSIIMKLSSAEPLVLGLVQSHGAPSTRDDLQAFYQELTKLYDVKQVDLSTKKIDESIKTLLLVGVKNEFTPEELKTIDAFLMQGKSVVFFQEGVNIMTNPTHFAVENRSNIFELLGKYGLTINKDLVGDVHSGLATFNPGFIEFNLNYRLWPKVIKANFNQDNALVSRLDSVVLPWVSSIEMKPELMPEAKYEELAKTSVNSYAQKESFHLDFDYQVPEDSEFKTRALAVMVSGKLKSAYEQGETDNGKIVVVGTSGFVKSNFIKGDASNLVFAQNIIDGVTLDSSISSISSKNVTKRSIVELTDDQKNNLRLINIFAVTILVFALGATRYYFRSKTKNLEL